MRNVKTFPGREINGMRLRAYPTPDGTSRQDEPSRHQTRNVTHAASTG